MAVHVPRVRSDVAAERIEIARDSEADRERSSRAGGGEIEGILQHSASSSSSLSQKGREVWIAVGSFIWVRLEDHCQAVQRVGSSVHHPALAVHLDDERHDQLQESRACTPCRLIRAPCQLLAEARGVARRSPGLLIN